MNTRLGEYIKLLNNTIKGIKLVTDKSVSTTAAKFVMLGIYQSIDDNSDSGNFRKYCLEKYKIKI